MEKRKQQTANKTEQTTHDTFGRADGPTVDSGFLCCCMDIPDEVVSFSIFVKVFLRSGDGLLSASSLIEHFPRRSRVGLPHLWAFSAMKTPLHAPSGIPSNGENALM